MKLINMRERNLYAHSMSSIIHMDYSTSCIVYGVELAIKRSQLVNQEWRLIHKLMDAIFLDCRTDEILVSHGQLLSIDPNGVPFK
jgi:hypothetical protein